MVRKVTFVDDILSCGSEANNCIEYHLTESWDKVLAVAPLSASECYVLTTRYTSSSLMIKLYNVNFDSGLYTVREQQNTYAYFAAYGWDNYASTYD